MMSVTRSNRSANWQPSRDPSVSLAQSTYVSISLATVRLTAHALARLETKFRPYIIIYTSMLLIAVSQQLKRKRGGKETGLSHNITQIERDIPRMQQLVCG